MREYIIFTTLYNHRKIKIKVNKISKSYTLVIPLVILLPLSVTGRTECLARVLWLLVEHVTS